MHIKNILNEMKYQIPQNMESASNFFENKFSKAVKKLVIWEKNVQNQNQQNVNFLQEPSHTLLEAEFLVLKCLIKNELNDVRETIEKVSQKFDQIFCREYSKNLWDEIASNNIIISLLTENINNLSRSPSQSETCYQPQKHNKAQNTQVLLNDQPFPLPRKEAKEIRIT